MAPDASDSSPTSGEDIPSHPWKKFWLLPQEAPVGTLVDLCKDKWTRMPAFPLALGDGANTCSKERTVTFGSTEHWPPFARSSFDLGLDMTTPAWNYFSLWRTEDSDLASAQYLPEWSQPWVLGSRSYWRNKANFQTITSPSKR